MPPVSRFRKVMTYCAAIWLVATIFITSAIVDRSTGTIGFALLAIMIGLPGIVMLLIGLYRPLGTAQVNTPARASRSLFLLILAPVIFIVIFVFVVAMAFELGI